MKTEITLVNKAKFFANYIGQTVHVESDIGEFVMELYGIDLDDVVNGDYLLLKPISSITDQDAEVAGISKRRLKQHILHHCIMTPLMDQILRSKGYALPWMGLSVDEMVQAGWIKLS